jgi:hypothetical protein
MSADLISNNLLLIYAKGSRPRIPEPITYDKEFNNYIRDDFITRLIE